MQTVSISITLLAFLQTVSSIAPNVNETLPDEDVNGTSGSHVTGETSFYFISTLLYYTITGIYKILYTVE